MCDGQPGFYQISYVMWGHLASQVGDYHDKLLAYLSRKVDLPYLYAP